MKNCEEINNQCVRGYPKGWSNVSGYGNIRISKPGKEFEIKNSIKPWNRIQRLTSPFSTPVNTKSAWTNQQNAISSKCDTMEMNTCEKRKVEFNQVLKAQKLI